MLGRHALPLVFVTIAIASASAALPPLTISADAGLDAVARKCLANAQGTIDRVTDDEPFVAVHPRDPRKLVSIWQTRSTFGSVIQWARTTDGGLRWSPPHAVPINACAGGPLPGGRRASDPWVTVAPDGRIYLSAITYAPGSGGGPDLVNALVAVTSPDFGATWRVPVAIATSPSPEISHDNLAITADPSRAGTAYAATTRAESPDPQHYSGRLGFSRTRDGGKTWEPMRALSPAINGERIGAPQIVADARSKRLYAVYHARVSGQSRIGVQLSDDGGTTWSPEIVAAPHTRGARVNHPGDTRFVLADDIFSAAVSPTDGRIVIAFADAHRSAGQEYGVSLIWSSDGRRWSQPLAVSEASDRTAWLPAVAIASDGRAAVAYQAADFAVAGAKTGRVRVRQFSPTPSGFDALKIDTIDEGPLSWPGDYQSVAAAGSEFAAVYGFATDIRAVVIRR
jgi:hypothetical protein